MEGKNTRAKVSRTVIWSLFCKRVSHKLWQSSKLRLNSAKLRLASSSEIFGDFLSESSGHPDLGSSSLRTKGITYDYKSMLALKF